VLGNAAGRPALASKALVDGSAGKGRDVHESLGPGDRFRLGTTSFQVRVGEQQIRERVGEIGSSLRSKLDGEVPVFIALLSGGFVFLADLVRAFGADHEVDFLKVSRYDPTQVHRAGFRDAEPTGVRVLHDLRSDIRGRTVVVVEGVRARGTKIQYVDRFLRLHQARRILYCALIEPSDAQRSVPLDESGFRIDKEFVVGYGLDYQEKHRNLPFIGVMDPSEDNSGPKDLA
jgi:hypoxanthine phosphoribosyltransferase